MTTRRLAAILAADVVGYSRMIGADEAGTLARLRALRREVVEPLVAENGGRVFKTTGDGLLAEFPSTVQALRCAIVVQERARGGELQIRIGVHQGDVVVEGDDLLGDGVNVAARLEGLAEPGGVCISGRVREDAAGKLALEVDDLGEPELKNIAQRHRVFRVRLDQPERPALALPDKPSIAVLPFQNISGDPEQEYFADGMVEEIITGLSRVRSFFVIARNSSFAYKGKSPDVRQVGRELGVRYVLEGSVRKAGDRLRITAQLVDATNGVHIWADRFDGSLEDVFDLQDQVTVGVVSAIEPRIRLVETERAQRKPTDSLQAYDLVLRALALMNTMSRERLQEAAVLLRQAIDLDPRYALAYAVRGVCLYRPIAQGWVQGTLSATREVVRLAREAVELGPEDPEVLWWAGNMIALPGGDLHSGIELVEKSLALNPNSAPALMIAGLLHAYAGDTERAIDYERRSERLNPLRGGTHRNFAIGLAHFVAERYEAAAIEMDRALRDMPDRADALRYRAASLALAGRVPEAQQTVEQLTATAPFWTVSRVRAHLEIDLNNIYKTPGIVDAICDGLRRAGLPE
jgi:adenylate cyclase